MTSVRVLAPAKLNLGLAILRKRPDRYHEIDTILAMIGLYDVITIHEAMDGGIEVVGMDDVPPESNLMTKAARAWADTADVPAMWRIEIDKRIPSPAGLGGASSDAAAVLLALNAMYNQPLPDATLHTIAASLGADCPFFLGSPVARARGIGTDLHPLPFAEGWAVIAVPASPLQAKTASLYAALTPDDYGIPDAIDRIEARIQHGHLPRTGLANSFARAASAAFPDLAELAEIVSDVCRSWSLSGAGPAVYALAEKGVTANRWAAELEDRLPAGVSLHVAPLLTARPEPELLP